MALISLNLYPGELQILDDLVLIAKAKSFTPQKVNRSTVIRDLMLEAMRESKQASSQTGGT